MLIIQFAQHQMKPNLRLDLRLDPRSGCQLNFTRSVEPRSNYYTRLGYRLLALPVEPCPDQALRLCREEAQLVGGKRMEEGGGCMMEDGG